MDHDCYSDDYLRRILTEVHTIAVVGASPRPERPSHRVMAYLQRRGYRAIPVNPFAAGTRINGEMCHARLADIAEPIDMVDVFRASDQVMAVAGETLKLQPLPKYFWMQLGIRNDTAAARLEAAGIKVVMNRCPKIEYGRLSSEIAWMGVNSRTLSSKRAPPPPGIQRLSLDRQSVGGGLTTAADQAASKRDGSA